MTGNNYPEQPGNSNKTGSVPPWNSPNQSGGAPGYFMPPTTSTGYNAQYPIPNNEGQPSYMPPTPVAVSPDDAYRLAEKRVNARLRFYKHLTSYLLVNALLWAIAFITWATTGAHSVWTLIWPIWVSVFWGIGLASDYFQTFGLSETTRQRMIEEELRRTRRY